MTIPLFSDSDLWAGTFKLLEEMGIPYKFIVYGDLKPEVVKSFDGVKGPAPAST